MTWIVLFLVDLQVVPRVIECTSESKVGRDKDDFSFSSFGHKRLDYFSVVIVGESFVNHAYPQTSVGDRSPDIGDFFARTAENYYSFIGIFDCPFQFAFPVLWVCRDVHNSFVLRLILEIRTYVSSCESTTTLIIASTVNRRRKIGPTLSAILFSLSDALLWERKTQCVLYHAT